jgi:hypothetical protein
MVVWMEVSIEQLRRVQAMVGSLIADWYLYWVGFIGVGSALLGIERVDWEITGGGQESVVILEEPSFVAHSVTIGVMGVMLRSIALLTFLLVLAQEDNSRTTIPSNLRVFLLLIYLFFCLFEISVPGAISKKAAVMWGG